MSESSSSTTKKAVKEPSAEDAFAKVFQTLMVFYATEVFKLSPKLEGGKVPFTASEFAAGNAKEDKGGNKKKILPVPIDVKKHLKNKNKM